VDSTGQQGTGHYAATTVATALSVGQSVDASGQAFIRALALGSEVVARLQSLLGHYGTRSQFTASVGGALGAVVVAGLLLGRDEGQQEHALGLAASGALALSRRHRDLWTR
jgi:2-methylcitrate dehydratase PrpD